jgi:hypothetical protein
LNHIVRSASVAWLCAFAAVPGHAQTAGCGAPVVFSSTLHDGSRVVLRIPQDALNDALGWQPGHGEPPISIGKAVSIATAWAAGHHDTYDELRVNEVTLDNVSCARGDGHWYYRVTFFPLLNGKVIYSGAYVIAILMDGKVIESHKVSAGS